ncbi:hypothetical protein GCM10010917_01760 [Paenibacillus physcomitrellae]|uniref:Uncharacterized protein n=1 Tax=Paenibacillus physcomitrellae TaxID=1619311 RepID=A0ABQ1FL50_9BACL|nr:hypothetical protein GCM10010917_01760 [Paenibacillus physcomitrellae]
MSDETNAPLLDVKVKDTYNYMISCSKIRPNLPNCLHYRRLGPSYRDKPLLPPRQVWGNEKMEIQIANRFYEL